MEYKTLHLICANYKCFRHEAKECSKKVMLDVVLDNKPLMDSLAKEEA